MKENKKIKIGFMIDQLDLGGTETQLLMLLEKLSIGDKFEPILFSLTEDRYTFINNSGYKKYILNINKFMSINGIKNFITFIILLKKEKIDILQTYFVTSNIIGVAAAKIAGIKVIIATRRDMGYWYNKAILWKLRIVNRFIDKMLTNSYAVKENVHKYEKIPLQKIDVIYNSIDIEKYKGNSNTKLMREKLSIGIDDWVGGIVANLNREVKRVDLFIKAAKHVLKEFPNTYFLIIGEGRLKSELQNLATMLNISNRIRFLGSQKDIIKYLSIFDIAVLSSDSEGLSNSLLEYMAMGLPVIATNVGGNTELLRDGRGIMINPNDIEGLSDAIIGMLKNENLRIKIGSLARKYVEENFSWSSIILQYEHFYNKLLKKE